MSRVNICNRLLLSLVVSCSAWSILVSCIFWWTVDQAAEHLCGASISNMLHKLLNQAGIARVPYLISCLGLRTLVLKSCTFTPIAGASSKSCLPCRGWQLDFQTQWNPTKALPRFLHLPSSLPKTTQTWPKLVYSKLSKTCHSFSSLRLRRSSLRDRHVSTTLGTMYKIIDSSYLSHPITIKWVTKARHIQFFCILCHSLTKRNFNPLRLVLLPTTLPEGLLRLAKKTHPAMAHSQCNNLHVAKSKT